MNHGWKVIESKSFVIPCLPPSVNAVYQIIFSQRRVEMKPEVRLWKSNVKEYIPKLTPREDSFLFQIDAVFFYDFFYKNGKVKKFDTPNMLKVLIDAVAEKGGFKDELVKFGSWESYHSNTEEKVMVTINQVKFEIPSSSPTTG